MLNKMFFVNVLILLIISFYSDYALYFVTAQLLGIILYMMYKFNNKNKKNINIDEYSELDKKLYPLLASCLTDEKGVYYNDIVATIINLIQKDYIAVDINKYYDKEELTLKVNPIGDPTTLSVTENSIYNYIMQSNDKVSLNKFMDKIKNNSDELLRTKSLMSNLTARLSNIYYVNNIAIFMTLVFAIVEFYLFSMINTNYIFMMIIFTLIIIIISLIKFKAERLVFIKDKYLDEKNQCDGFKNYLKSYSKLKEKDITESNKFNYYFPYLIAFNLLDNLDLDKVNSKLVKVYKYIINNS